MPGGTPGADAAAAAALAPVALPAPLRSLTLPPPAGALCGAGEAGIGELYGVLCACASCTLASRREAASSGRIGRSGRTGEFGRDALESLDILVSCVVQAWDEAEHLAGAQAERPHDRQALTK